MNNDLISREALLKEIKDRIDDNPETSYDRGYNLGLNTAIIETKKAPTAETKTTAVVISDDFGHEIKGLYDKGRDMIFTSFGNAPRMWFDIKYKITEVKE